MAFPGDQQKYGGCFGCCKADLSGEPKQKEDGQLWTPGAVDFFRIVNEQVSVVEEASNGEMLLRTGESVMTIMRQFQARSHYYAHSHWKGAMPCRQQGLHAGHQMVRPCAYGVRRRC